MTTEELRDLQREKWRQHGRPIRTLDDAREFVEQMGVCAFYGAISGVSSAVQGPSFVAAWVGEAARLPTQRTAFSDARAGAAEGMAARLVVEQIAVPWPVGEDRWLVAGAVFPFLYALAADRNGRQEPSWSTGERLSRLAADTWKQFERSRAPLSAAALQLELGRELSSAAIERALHELWMRLRIMPRGRDEAGEALWEPVSYLWANITHDSERLPIAGALSALISRWLDGMIAAELAEAEDFFSPLAPRTKIREAINGLIAAGEISPIQVGRHAMLRITPQRPVPRARTEASAERARISAAPDDKSAPQPGRRTTK